MKIFMWKRFAQMERWKTRIFSIFIMRYCSFFMSNQFHYSMRLSLNRESLTKKEKYWLGWQQKFHFVLKHFQVISRSIWVCVGISLLHSPVCRMMITIFTKIDVFPCHRIILLPSVYILDPIQFNPISLPTLIWNAYIQKVGDQIFTKQILINS
jgi:hypothetical protein